MMKGYVVSYLMSNSFPIRLNYVEVQTNLYNLHLNSISLLLPN